MNLHSTIFRFVQDAKSAEPPTNTFTFHYFQICTIQWQLVHKQIQQFTFHYFQICTPGCSHKTEFLTLFTFHYFQICTLRLLRFFQVFHHLHSTIFRFVHDSISLLILIISIYIPLFLDLYNVLFHRVACISVYLHSTIFRFVQEENNFYLLNNSNLHSTIFRFVRQESVVVERR